MIGDNIEIQILEIKGHQVRLGFTASKDIPINRTEIWERLRAEKAAGGSGVLMHTKIKP